MEHQISPMTSPSAAAAATNPSDPLHTWWTSISKARSRIHLLSTLLPSLDPTIADSDNPSLSLLSSFSAYSAFSSSLSSNPHPLCHWLYDTFLLPDLQPLTLNFIPTLTSLYFSNLTHHHSNSNSNNSISAFEAVLLAIYSSETKSRNGKPITVSLPDLSLPSLYHNPNPASAHPSTFKSYAPRTAVVSPPLEAQAAVKSTKRGVIVGVVFECYFKRISEMPSWSKLDFCKFVVGWAGQDCECKSEFDETDSFDEEVVVEKDDVVGKRRIPLPWELLQPMLKILGHCLLGPLNGSEVKDGAAEAVRSLYARACHDLVPQAILATRSLIQLDNRGRKDAVLAAVNVVSSNSNTPSKASKKPEILLVSK